MNIMCDWVRVGSPLGWMGQAVHSNEINNGSLC